MYTLIIPNSDVPRIQGTSDVFQNADENAMSYPISILQCSIDDEF